MSKKCDQCGGIGEVWENNPYGHSVLVPCTACDETGYERSKNNLPGVSAHEEELHIGQINKYLQQNEEEI